MKSSIWACLGYNISCYISPPNRHYSGKGSSHPIFEFSVSSTSILTEYFIPSCRCEPYTSKTSKKNTTFFCSRKVSRIESQIELAQEIMNGRENWYRFAFLLRTKFSNNLRLIKIASFVLMIFTISEIYFYPLTKLFSGEQMFFLTSETKHVFNFTEIASLDNLTRTTQPMTQSLKVRTTQPMKQSQKLNGSHERYGLVEKYEQDSLLEVDPPFKRILFWNDVSRIPQKFHFMRFKFDLISVLGNS